MAAGQEQEQTFYTLEKGLFPQGSPYNNLLLVAQKALIARSLESNLENRGADLEAVKDSLAVIRNGTATIIEEKSL